MLQDDLLVEIGIPKDLNADSLRFFEWTKVLRVCQRWRAVGFATSTLWNTVFIPRESRPVLPFYDLRSHLRRSANCSLYVFMNILAAPADTFKALAQMHRIRELTCEVHCTPAWAFSPSLPLRWSNPGPQVRGLTFCTPQGLRSLTRELPKLFMGRFSHLPALCLTRITGADQYSWTRLRHLHLNNFNCSDWPEVISLLNLLANVPVLEDLMFTLFNREVGDVPFLTATEPTIDLPRLRRLAFMKEGCAVPALLSHLQIPAGVSLSFPWVKPFRCWDTEALMANLEHSEYLHDLHDLEVRMSAPFIVTVRGVGESSAFYARWQLDRARGVIQVGGPTPIGSFVRRLYLHLPPSQSEAHRVYRRHFVRILGAAASKVQALYVTGDTVSALGDVEAMLGKTGTEMKSLEEIHFPRRAADDYAALQLALLSRPGVRRVVLYEEAPCEPLWDKDYSADTRNPACLRQCVPEVAIVQGRVAEMEWVEICSKQSDGPWDWPVWTKDGGCSVEYDPDLDIEQELNWP